MAFRSTLGPQLNGAWTRAQAFVRRTMLRSARNFERSMQMRLRGPTGANTLRRRTGALARSVDARVSTAGSVVTLFATAGAGAPYARIHEKGGVITPKKGGALAIPTRRMQTMAGVSRVPSPRMVPGLFVVKKAGKAFLARRIGGGGKKQKGGGGLRGKIQARGSIEILFTLAKSVTIKPRLGFERTWRTEINTRLRPRLTRGIAIIARGGPVK